MPKVLQTDWQGKSATTTKYESKNQSSKTPVGFSLPKLQMIASKKYDLSSSKTLEICQKLYEHGILTYPRSDCEFLPEAHHDKAEKIFSVIEKLSSVKVPENVDKERTTPVFNTKKVEEHHAIIPSASCKISNALEGNEALIFELVAKRYISFFMPDFEYLQVNISAEIDGIDTAATQSVLIQKGKKLISSQYARDIIHSLHENIMLPDLTALGYFYLYSRDFGSASLKVQVRSENFLFLRNL